MESVDEIPCIEKNSISCCSEYNLECSESCLKTKKSLKKSLKSSLARESSLRRQLLKLNETIKENNAKIRYWKQKFKRQSEAIIPTPEKNVKKNFKTGTQRS